MIETGFERNLTDRILYSIHLYTIVWKSTRSHSIFLPVLNIDLHSFYIRFFFNFFQFSFLYLFFQFLSFFIYSVYNFFFVEFSNFQLFLTILIRSPNKIYHGISFSTGEKRNQSTDKTSCARYLSLFNLLKIQFHLSEVIPYKSNHLDPKLTGSRPNSVPD